MACIIMYFTEMFEKKDCEIKELQANVSMLETRVIKLEQQIDENSAAETKYQKNNYQHDEGIGSLPAARTQLESNSIHDTWPAF